MNGSENEDMVWLALKRTANEVAPSIPEGLLRQMYNIQRDHEFALDSAESVKLMERCVDDFIERHA